MPYIKHPRKPSESIWHINRVGEEKHPSAGTENQTCLISSWALNQDVMAISQNAFLSPFSSPTRLLLRETRRDLHFCVAGLYPKWIELVEHVYWIVISNSRKSPPVFVAHVISFWRTALTQPYLLAALYYSGLPPLILVILRAKNNCNNDAFTHQAPHILGSQHRLCESNCQHTTMGWQTGKHCPPHLSAHLTSL